MSSPPTGRVRFTLTALYRLKALLEKLESDPAILSVFRIYYRGLPPDVARRLSHIKHGDLLRDAVGQYDPNVEEELIASLIRPAVAEQIDRAITYYENEAGVVKGWFHGG